MLIHISSLVPQILRRLGSIAPRPEMISALLSNDHQATKGKASNPANIIALWKKSDHTAATKPPKKI